MCPWTFTLRSLIVVAVASSTATTDSSAYNSPRLDIRQRCISSCLNELQTAHSMRLRGGQASGSDSESDSAPWLNENYTVPQTSQEWEERVLEQARKRVRNIILRRREVDPETGRTVNLTRREFTWEEQTDLMCLHWLVVNCYKPAALQLHVAARLDGSAPMAGRQGPPLRVDLARLLEQSRIDMRRTVKDALYQGHILQAQHLVSAGMGEMFWASHIELLFRLLLQHFLELVRGGGVGAALEFVREQLPPFIEANPGLLNDLEHAMAVLTVDPEHPEGHPAAPLLSLSRRALLFQEVNAAMLRVLRVEPRTGPELLSTMADWAEGELAKNGWLGEGLPRDKHEMAMQAGLLPEEEEEEELEAEEEEQRGAEEGASGRAQGESFGDIIRGLQAEAAAELEEELRERGSGAHAAPAGGPASPQAHAHGLPGLSLL